MKCNKKKTKIVCVYYFTNKPAYREMQGSVYSSPASPAPGPAQAYIPPSIWTLDGKGKTRGIFMT